MESRVNRFGDSVSLGARLVSNVPYAQKSIWMHPIELLDHVCHMESRSNLFGDSVSLGATLVYGLRIMHHRLRNHYVRTR